MPRCTCSSGKAKVLPTKAYLLFFTAQIFYEWQVHIRKTSNLISATSTKMCHCRLDQLHYDRHILVKVCT